MSFEPQKTDYAKKIRELARQDADRLTPAFSPELHRGLMQRIEHVRIEQPMPTLSLAAWFKPVMLAAAAMIAVAIIQSHLWHIGNGADRGLNARVQPPDHTTSNPAATQVAFAEMPWTGLDQDVAVATRYLVEQVPLRDAWQADDSAGATDNRPTP